MQIPAPVSALWLSVNRPNRSAHYHDHGTANKHFIGSLLLTRPFNAPFTSVPIGNTLFKRDHSLT
ncbi:hypothetical protein PY95_08630 [Lacticaseibacillus rhamnosus]|nr:hypothetical protein PY95_08630 [Lacticaseibacillus rhamnosus]OAU00698.1 hypothetical protein PY72_08630 [Lacticaseibacillus rhamnosus]